MQKVCGIIAFIRKGISQFKKHQAVDNSKNIEKILDKQGMTNSPVDNPQGEVYYTTSEAFCRFLKLEISYLLMINRRKN